MGCMFCSSCACACMCASVSSSSSPSSSLKKKKKNLRITLGPVWIFFNHSSLLTQFSSLITHHSSLKIPQLPTPYPFRHCFQFSSLKYFNLFVGPITDHQVRPIPDHLKHPTNRRSSNLFSLYVFLKMVAASSSSLSSSSMASSSAWSPFAEMVSLKPLARWGKDDLDLYP